MENYFHNEPGERFYRFYVSIDQVIMSKINQDSTVITIYDTVSETAITCDELHFRSELRKLMVKPFNSYIYFNLQDPIDQKNIIKCFPGLFSRIDKGPDGKDRLVTSDNPFLLDIRNKKWRKNNGQEKNSSTD